MGTSTSFFFSGAADRKILSRDRTRTGAFHPLRLWRFSSPDCTLAATGRATSQYFDNHPDWAIRPQMGMRRLDKSRAWLPQVQRVRVGCGNFEYWWPRRIFGNRRAERKGRLELHPWADNRGRRARERRGAMCGRLAAAFSRFRQGTERRRSLCDDRSGLFARGRCDHKLGKWLFQSGRSGMGLARLRHATQIIAGDFPALSRRRNMRDGNSVSPRGWIIQRSRHRIRRTFDGLTRRR